MLGVGDGVADDLSQSSNRYERLFGMRTGGGGWWRGDDDERRVDDDRCKVKDGWRMMEVKDG